MLLLMGSAQAHKGEADNYNKSVFRGFERIQPTDKGTAAQTQLLVQQQFPGWIANTDKLTSGFRNIFGSALQIPGQTLTDKVAFLFQQKLTALGVASGEWIYTNSTDAPHARFVRFKQQIQGRDVLFSSLQFRFTTDGRIQQIEQKSYGAQTGASTPSILASDAAAAAISDISQVLFSNVRTTGDWLWMPTPNAQGYTLRPVWPVLAEGKAESGLPVKLRAYVDAVTGEVLYRYNEVREIDRTVKAVVYKQNPLVAPTLEPLTDLFVQIGSSNYITDSNGFYSDASLSAPINATMNLEGSWSKVYDDATGITPSYVDNITVNTGGVYTYPTSTTFGERYINAYYHTTLAHDHMKALLPAFNGMDVQLPTNVDVGTTNCNAFYNGSSINFLPEGGGCNSFAICGDIVYHEYGHGISDIFYQSQGTNFQNGGLGEGNSDVWGFSITANPVLGAGSFIGGGGGFIRRYDLAPKVYPQDLTGQVHDDGEIIAGAWWDVGVNTNNIPLMGQLFALTYYNLPNGPDGTEGQVYYDVLIAALLNDDNDANLANGTPHFLEIANAFARHGIYLLADANVAHNEVANQPLNAPITINATINVATPAFLAGASLVYKSRGTTTWDTVAMTTSGGNAYTATIPAQTSADIFDYHFILQDQFNTSDIRFPRGFTTLGLPNERNIPYQFGIGLYAGLVQDFETVLDTSWKVANIAGDNATGGKWIQAEPVGSNVNTSQGGIQIQTDNDHTLNNNTGKCLVTANAPTSTSPPGTADVDGGKTTVLSPVFDLSNYQKPVVEYYRWFSNNYGSNPGDDNIQIQIKGVANPLWKDVDYTLRADESWRRRIFFVNQFVTNPTQVHMRFIAQDQGSPTLVEVAVDDLVIYDVSPVTSVPGVKPQLASVFPNPADEALRIVLAQAGQGRIGLYDVTGKMIHELVLEPGQTTYELSTKSLTAGHYLLVIRTDAAIQTKQIHVRH